MPPWAACLPLRSIGLRPRSTTTTASLSRTPLTTRPASSTPITRGPRSWPWPGTWPAGAFDDVIAVLVLHYLEDWTAPLAELRRVLKPGGRLIVAVDHPFAIALMQREAGLKTDYFATCNRTEEWDMGGPTVPMSFWSRPLHAMTDAFTAAGFRICVISEPDPLPEARELFPDEFADIPSSFLCFIFFVLQAG